MSRSIVVALSGGVDSAVAAWQLREAGHDVQGLHMTNWEDDGYCDAARDFQDARAVCLALGVPLHRINFAAEYREQVFAHFLEEYRHGRTPNPDVLCNREIKFGVMRRHAKRLGAELVATGHYARITHAHDADRDGGGAVSTCDGDTGSDAVWLLKGRDPAKDQSYFLHAVAAADFADACFPLGDLTKTEVRAVARRAGLPVAAKKDSTGICFIGERPFAEFLRTYLPDEPGLIRDADGHVRGQHRGLAYYTLGQRQGIGIGGVAALPGVTGEPWYVAAKDPATNELVVVQGHDHPLLYRDGLQAADMHWIGAPPRQWHDGDAFRCHAKIRYRQADQPCTVTRADDGAIGVSFDQPQRTPTPGQYVVLYSGDRCLGGATIAADANDSRAASADAGTEPSSKAAIPL
jgi:tRNA-specific 2-thiouridylase